MIRVSYLGVVALLLCVACESGGPSAVTSSTAMPSESASATPAPSSTVQSNRRRSTSAAIAIRNVNAEIPQIKAKLARRKKDVPSMASLASLYMIRSSKLGLISDLDLVVELGRQATEARPKLPRSWMLQAQVHGAVHRFADAMKSLDEAESLKASPTQLKSARATNFVALGRYDEALAIVEQLEEERGAKYEVLFGKAMVLGKMGRFAESDAAFERAVASSRSISPFPMAAVEFERGAMWDRAGNEEKAKQYYAAAVERLPQFAHAAGHLAYKLPHDEAVALVKKIIETSDDPEYLGTLGYLLNKKEPGSGDAWVDKARAGYAELMKKHPLAFADHAGWFYVVIAKDYDKGVEVAEMNLENRPTPEAFELMLAALDAAGQGADACDVADRALALKYPTLALKRRSATAYEKCGRQDEAAELRKAADAMVVK